MIDTRYGGMIYFCSVIPKGYSPENCRFVDIITQANNRSNNRMITFNGKTMTVAQWSRELGLPYGIVKNHTKKGGSLAEIKDNAI